MTDNEIKLLHMIRTNENPENALKVALDLMIEFLDGREAPQDTSHAHLQESA